MIGLLSVKHITTQHHLFFELGERQLELDESAALAQRQKV